MTDTSCIFKLSSFSTLCYYLQSIVSLIILPIFPLHHISADYPINTCYISSHETQLYSNQWSFMKESVNFFITASFQINNLRSQCQCSKCAEFETDALLTTTSGLRMFEQTSILCTFGLTCDCNICALLYDQISKLSMALFFSLWLSILYYLTFDPIHSISSFYLEIHLFTLMTSFLNF